MATATVEGGTLPAAPRATAGQGGSSTAPRAEAIAAAAEGFSGPLSVRWKQRRQAPPRLFDLPALQKTCGQRWGWTAEKTLSVAQELYDGEGKKLITYPRAEARYLAENQIGDVPAIVRRPDCACAASRTCDIGRPVIRRGKSGHFCDKALEGVSHHAIVPNVNVMADLEARIARLSDDEKRLFALICRSYLAAVMPDYEYRQTTVTMPVPMPEGRPVEFRAVGRIPLKAGWKAVYGSASRAGRGRAGRRRSEQTLPPLADGEIAAADRGHGSKRNGPSRRRATTRARWSTPCRTPGASSRTRPCASG